MSTNRQPKDRINAIEAYHTRLAEAVSDALPLYQADVLKVHVSRSKEGKIKGVASISVLPDEGCIKAYERAAPGIVCGRCYALGALMTYRINLIKRLAQNTVLMSGPVRDHAIPRGLVGPVRINAFGEIMNHNHARWVVEIARANPRAIVSVITKQLIWFRAVSLPKNLILIRSYYRVNDTTIDDEAHKTYCVIDYPETESMKRDPQNAPCHDGCFECYLHDENCYSRSGPKRILRQLQ